MVEFYINAITIYYPNFHALSALLLLCKAPIYYVTRQLVANQDVKRVEGY